MLTQFEHTHFNQQLADVQTRFQDSEWANLCRIPLENIANGQQDNLVVNAAIACYIKGGARRLRLIHARVIDVGVRVGAQHLTTVTGGGAAHASATITTSVSSHTSNTAAITQGIQLGVDGAL